jgi:hypothetical protein
MDHELHVAVQAVSVVAGSIDTLSKASLEYLVVMSGSAALSSERVLQLPRP